MSTPVGSLLLRSLKDALKGIEMNKTSRGALILSDEPESMGVDLEGVLSFRDTIEELAENQGVQFVIGTHNHLLWSIKSANLIVLGDNPDYAKESLEKYSRIIQGGKK